MAKSQSVPDRFPFLAVLFGIGTLSVLFAKDASDLTSIPPSQITHKPPFPHPILDRLGGRSDKNSVGHGRNVAVYSGQPSRFFFATHELRDIFSAVNGKTIEWFPDFLVIDPVNSNSSRSSEGIVEMKQVCVTKEDVVVSRIYLTNISGKAISHRIGIRGDCRLSFDWREKPGGEKFTGRIGDQIILRDLGVFPAYLKEGLSMVVGGSERPLEIDATVPGTYRMLFEVRVPARATRSLTIACAIDPDSQRAQKNLKTVLKQKDPIADNRKEWAKFFDGMIPRFTCSDRGLEELYAFRWFLLRFSTAGGDLGYFKYPVVMEGRQAYQTYCCYSAPFMAFDMNWAVDPNVGFGHIATMALAAYEDGRFPWYTSPRTNKVKLDHDSRTGLSLLPQAAWKHFVIHGDTNLLRSLYPRMKRNVEWWIRDRDSDHDGLFAIAHQYETGMDDLHRWGSESMTWRYDAVDATSYAFANLRAVEKMARVLSESNDASFFQAYAEKTKNALNSLLWDKSTESWRDRNPQTHTPADVLAVTTFYPFYAGAAKAEHLGVFRKHLLNPEQFWLPFPVPALAKDQRGFNPEGFWQGPSWPAATTHVVQAFASAAKTFDRSLLPEAGELLKRAAKVHLQPRPDFFERYNPETGRPLSTFRDYMHSWWIDLIIQHVAGLMVEEDGNLVIDPLPLGLDHFELRGAPVRGKRVDVLWHKPAQGSSVFVNSSEYAEARSGLVVRVNGKTVLYQSDFKPGDAPSRLKMP